MLYSIVDFSRNGIGKRMSNDYDILLSCIVLYMYRHYLHLYICGHCI